MEIEEIKLDLGDLIKEESKIECPELKKFEESYEGTSNSLEGDFIDSTGIITHISGVNVLQKERKSGKLLYLACAYGYGVKLFDLLGYKTQGIDINPRYIHEGIKRNLNVQIEDATNLSFLDNSFDITISRNFLRNNYLTQENITKSLSEQYRVLKPKGITVNYTLLFDGLGLKYGLSSRLLLSEIGSSPFEKIRRYKLEYKLGEKNMFKYVDVLEK